MAARQFTEVMWQVRRIDKAGVIDPHKKWLVKCDHAPGWKATEATVGEEIAEVKQLVKHWFDTEFEPLEDGNWSLDVEIVEFEHGSRIAVL
jgi:hypothetical protein